MPGVCIPQEHSASRMHATMKHTISSRSHQPLKAAVLCSLVFIVAGCSTLGLSSDTSGKPAAEQKPADCNCATGAKAQAGREKAPELGEQRLILSEGYSLLHTDATKLNLSELVLLAKFESDALKDVIKDVAEYAGKVEKDLERIARDYPGVRIDLDPLPVMEKRKRWDLGKNRAIDFAPIVGRGGREYERTVLLSLLNGINHERHMCKVMAKEEPEASLKKFLTDTQKGYDVFYDRIEALLNKEYFRN